MLRHIALFRFKDSTEPSDIEALEAALRTLPGVIPEIRNYEMGADLGLNESNHDFVVVADFDDEPTWRVYTTHPAHIEVVTTKLMPILAEADRIQHRL